MLKRVYASLRDDMSSPADWFEIDADQAAPEKKPEAEKKPLPACSNEDFDKNKDEWRTLIVSKKKSVKALLSMIRTSYTLTEAQELTIDSWSHENE
jgi:hypothetical protein